MPTNLRMVMHMARMVISTKSQQFSHFIVRRRISVFSGIRFFIWQHMATVFETRLIGNIGKDAHVKTMERGIVAINFPVAHNKNWKDKKTGQMRTKTTWVNCTIWKRDSSNMRITDF